MDSRDEKVARLEIDIFLKHQKVARLEQDNILKDNRIVNLERDILLKDKHLISNARKLIELEGKPIRKIELKDLEADCITHCFSKMVILEHIASV